MADSGGDAFRWAKNELFRIVMEKLKDISQIIAQESKYNQISKIRGMVEEEIKINNVSVVNENKKNNIKMNTEQRKTLAERLANIRSKRSEITSIAKQILKTKTKGFEIGGR